MFCKLWHESQTSGNKTNETLTLYLSKRNFFTHQPESVSFAVSKLWRLSLGLRFTVKIGKNVVSILKGLKGNFIKGQYQIKVVK